MECDELDETLRLSILALPVDSSGGGLLSTPPRRSSGILVVRLALTATPSQLLNSIDC